MSQEILNQTNDSSDIQKYIQQIEKKKEYNRSYYQNKIKPKRVNEKQELGDLRERYEQLVSEMYRLQNNQDSPLLENFKRQNQNLIDENLELKQRIIKLTQDNENINQLLDIARQRNYELMMKKSVDLLPPLKNIAL